MSELSGDDIARGRALIASALPKRPTPQTEPTRDTTAVDYLASLPANIAEHVRRVVATAPPLTDSQRERIATLLRGSR